MATKTSHPGRPMATRVTDGQDMRTRSSSDTEPETLAEGSGYDWYALWLHTATWAGIIALVLLVGSIVEARASEPARIWTPAEMGTWLQTLPHEGKAKPSDCVGRQPGVPRGAMVRPRFDGSAPHTVYTRP